LVILANSLSLSAEMITLRTKYWFARITLWFYPSMLQKRYAGQHHSMFVLIARLDLGHRRRMSRSSRFTAILAETNNRVKLERRGLHIGTISCFAFGRDPSHLSTRAGLRYVCCFQRLDHLFFAQPLVFWRKVPADNPENGDRSKNRRRLQAYVSCYRSS